MFMICFRALTLSSTWKQKVRKLLRASLRHRINDGNHSLTAMMDASKAASLYADSSAIPVKTRLRNALKKVVLSAGAGVNTAAPSRKKNEPAQMITCDANIFPDSSDEESNHVAPSIPYVVTCSPHLAPDPPKMWPPVLSMGPRAPVTSLKRRTPIVTGTTNASNAPVAMTVPPSSMDLHTPASEARASEGVQDNAKENVTAEAEFVSREASVAPNGTEGNIEVVSSVPTSTSEVSAV